MNLDMLDSGKPGHACLLQQLLLLLAMTHDSLSIVNTFQEL